jgi:tagatose-1,6-bisphosphate aldolase non-catalytic subunit AgaZ/GatZ
MIEDVHRTSDVFHVALRAHGWFAAWENVGLVVQPAVEFGEFFDFMVRPAVHLQLDPLRIYR